ncbi:MAG: phospho-N-acetylmuramoyl-pentapeptide-transferase [Anaerolineae bacterium]|nr:phospho-N-acetylmuramoyl-pentapeptide-transferase [Anaerolineae bacterium]
MEVSDLPFALTLGSFTFVLVVMWGEPFVEMLHRLRLGKQIRQAEILPGHQHKRGTPTMGGIIIVVPTLALTVGLNLAALIREGLTGQSILIPLFVLVGFALLGAWDDLEGIFGRTAALGEGISARAKFLAQFGLAGATAGTMSLAGVQFADTISIPLFTEPIPIPAWLWVPLAVFIIIGTSNAVNLTDGMDGLAGIITATAFAAYGIIASMQDQTFLVQFCFILVGACFGFLWYNAKPAQMFMGDTGSLALGAALGTVALMTGQWLLLPIIAIIPVAEALSVMIQVWYTRLTGAPMGKRIFRRAPLHHHFEMGTWSETQVVQRFWLVGILSAMVGIALMLL